MAKIESFVGQAWRSLLDKSLFVNQPFGHG